MENEENNKDKFEHYLYFKKDNYVSRVNADNLTALEAGLLLHLKEVQEYLATPWDAESNTTVREVLENKNTKHI